MEISEKRYITHVPCCFRLTYAWLSIRSVLDLLVWAGAVVHAAVLLGWAGAVVHAARGTRLKGRILGGR